MEGEAESSSSRNSPPATKRRRIMSLSEKFGIVNRLAAGEGSSRIARDHDVAESAVRRIGKQQATIRAAVETLGKKGAEAALKQRNLRLYKMESCLLVWLEDMRAKRLPVWSTKICAKAVQIYEAIGELGYEDSAEFLASFGWFTRFRKKYGLAEVRPHADRVPPIEVEFLASVKNMIRDGGFSREQIFMAERTTFWWKRFPGLSEQESVNLMLCCNASGDFVTYHRLEEEDDKTVQFLTWFIEQFVPNKTTYLQVNELAKDSMLVLASDESYPQDLYEDSIKIVYLPPECNSSLLPAVQGILQHLNAVYLKNLSEYLIAEVNTGTPLRLVWHRFTLDQAMQLLSKCIAQLHKSTLAIAWIKLFQDIPGRFCNEMLLRQITVNAATLKIHNSSINLARKLITPAELTTEEVIELFHKQQMERIRLEGLRTEVKQEPVDPSLISELDRHLAALAEARAFFMANDRNGVRQELTMKRLEQVCGWAGEMRAELVEQVGERSEEKGAAVVDEGGVGEVASCEFYEEITIKEETLGLDSEGE
ncbi:tigger transposable element-derived protein 1-like isoform X1 [Culex pipiens pallens]|uniref:tigger transposable element-derived protein 1-like isoform X1 n=1 Tax=Culex pipiens pallens TaxID=42434 RepID=UPI00195357CA|nr:tigger transposable element-derived protein 1-like isoform X1 [Culex pipiens pallens]